MLLYQGDNSFESEHFHYTIYRDTSFIPHFHQYYEVFYVLYGEVNITIDNETFIAKQDDMAFVLPNQIHYFSINNDSKIWVSLFSEDLVETFSNLIKNKTTNNPIFNCGSSIKEYVKENLTRVSTDDILILKSFLYAICSQFHRSAHLFDKPKNYNELNIYNIIQYISNHFTEDITLKRISEIFGYNTNYLSRLFNNFTKMSFKTFLNAYRISLAKKELISTSLPIQDIAFKCGFNTVRNFNHAFIFSEKVTPSQFRRQQI